MMTTRKPGVALIFDCDGVLVNTEQIAIEVERLHLEWVGLIYSDEEFHTRFLGLPDTAFWAALNADRIERHGLALPSDFAETVKVEKLARFQTELKPVEDVKTLLAAWTGLLAVASSSEYALLLQKLEWTGLSSFFCPHVYSADQVARGKPHPDLFLYTAKQIGADPKSCIVIEDSLNGVQAAQNAGMEVWGFTGGGHADCGLQGRLKDAGCSQVFATFKEMQRYIERL
jgi:HAD superfamily hydrolase (TIGR01509 family)